MWDQVADFAKVVKADSKLAGGFNAVGLSQGGLIVRGYIEAVNNPPVYNFVSICGVQGGEFQCPLEVALLCDILNFYADPYDFLFGLNDSFVTPIDYWVTSQVRSAWICWYACCELGWSHSCSFHGDTPASCLLMRCVV